MDDGTPYTPDARDFIATFALGVFVGFALFVAVFPEVLA